MEGGFGPLGKDGNHYLTYLVNLSEEPMSTSGMSTSDKIAFGAAVISLLSLIVTIVFAILGRRYTKTQIQQVDAQIRETKDQFTALNTPDVDIDINWRGKPAEQRGMWLKVTNHHPTITVTNLRVYAIGDSPTKKDAFNLMFLTPNDLKPMDTIEERSMLEIEPLLREHFPEYDSSGALISDDPMKGSTFHSFPMKIYVSYHPRLINAQKIEYVKDAYFVVNGKKGR